MRTVLIHTCVMDAVAAPAALHCDPGFVSLAALRPAPALAWWAWARARSTLSALERRLLEFGFVHGEQVEILAEARPGRDPFVVRVGPHDARTAPARGAERVGRAAALRIGRITSGSNCSTPRLASRTAMNAPAAAAVAAPQLHRLPGRRPELRQDRALQSSHRQPAESRQLSGRHGRAQGGAAHRAAHRRIFRVGRSARRLQPRAHDASMRPSPATWCSAGMRASRARICWCAWSMRPTCASTCGWCSS